MSSKLHLVFGGRLTQPGSSRFEDLEQIDIVGMYPGYAAAHDAWKAKAQATVDDAHTRYFIAHLHRLRDEERETSADTDALER
ncbi:MAG: DUF4170 domain-containing protein [Pseudomonadota bacterium]